MSVVIKNTDGKCAMAIRRFYVFGYKDKPIKHSMRESDDSIYYISTYEHYLNIRQLRLNSIKELKERNLLYSNGEREG